MEYIKQYYKCNMCNKELLFITDDDLRKYETKNARNCIENQCHGIMKLYFRDNVSHPIHYTSHPSGIECWTVTRHMSFNLGNAVKYIWRCGIKDKDKDIEDLKKAVAYLEDEIKLREGEYNK